MWAVGSGACCGRVSTAEGFLHCAKPRTGTGPTLTASTVFFLRLKKPIAAQPPTNDRLSEDCRGSVISSEGPAELDQGRPVLNAAAGPTRFAEISPTTALGEVNALHFR